MRSSNAASGNWRISMLWIMRGVRSCLISGRIDNDCDNCISKPNLQEYLYGAYSLLVYHLTISIYSGQGEICASDSKIRANKSQLHYDRLREVSMGKVTGLGGVFFKADNPTQLGEWYR